MKRQSHICNHRPFGCVHSSKTPLVSKCKANKLKTICHSLTAVHPISLHPFSLSPLSSFRLFALIFSCTSMFVLYFLSLLFQTAAVLKFPHFHTSPVFCPVFMWSSIPQFALYFLRLPLAPCDLNYNM